MIPLPSQPAGVPWPTEAWPEGQPPARAVRHGLHKLLDLTFAEPQPATTTKTNAIVVVHHGRIVAERYAEGVTRDDTQPSWSMAKSVLHAAVGVLVRDGRIDVNARAAVPEWQGADDPRRDITVDALLHMTPGLAFREDYVNDGVSDVIQMLFRPGYDDTGGFAASFPQIRPVDDVSNYSSGTTNIISRVVRDIVGRDEAYHDFLRRELLQPTGMTTAMPRFDKAGTWIASSYCFATPRDFARFGLLYLRDGVWDGRRILPEGWVDYARSPAPAQPRDTPLGYGAHWWLLRDDLGTFSANGYQGQHILVVPALDLVVVRNGDTPVERRPYLLDLLRMIVNCFRDT